MSHADYSTDFLGFLTDSSGRRIPRGDLASLAPILFPVVAVERIKGTGHECREGCGRDVIRMGRCNVCAMARRKTRDRGRDFAAERRRREATS
jgi:hypothetical protein